MLRELAIARLVRCLGAIEKAETRHDSIYGMGGTGSSKADRFHREREAKTDSGAIPAKVHGEVEDRFRGRV